MHPGLDLATFLKLNPTIHPYCDNMLIGQKVCVGATQHNDSPKPAEPSAQQWESSPNQWETSAAPKPQETSPPQETRPPQETGSQQWESSPKQWGTSAAPKPQEPSSTASHGWH
jgi:hypothetical protein